MTTELPQIQTTEDGAEAGAETEAEIRPPTDHTAEPPTAREATAGWESPFAEETPAAGDTPFAEQAPAPGEPPLAAEVPAVEKTSSAAEVPAPEETAPAAEVPAVEHVPEAGETPAAQEAPDQDESGDEAVRTLLTTAATERPVEEVAALVARLQETGELSSPADVALRAAAVTRPLDEVRELIALLNASGYDLHEAETTLRAAAVGRPIEDVVRLVGILGTEDPAPAAPRPAAAPAAPKRPRSAAEGTRSHLDRALAVGPGSHSTSPALRSVLRWPAALALVACGLVHLPTDLTGLRSGGDTETLSVVVTVLCLVGAAWLATRDTLVAWAAAAGLGVAVIALHGVATARAVDLLGGSLGATSAWAKALALLGAVAVVALAASAVVHHTTAAGAPDNA
ncbi:hypothetical protein ACFUJ0_21665 [Streptomyces sp. NPDC057242]|uniref:hypothetical protein n=1 Tax=Streptomyces sp. NPDC057242 TaxID=3346063 RepID=UPI003630C413